MRYLACLLLSIAAGCGAYAVGAVAWSAVDPEGAGAKLLFTIPVALTGMTVPGALGMLCFVFRGALVPEPKRAKLRFAKAAIRKPRPEPTSAPAVQIDEDELEVVLAA